MRRVATHPSFLLPETACYYVCMLNVTLQKFGYPDTLVKEYQHWYVLCRFKQVTLGSLILICKDQVDAFSKISPESFAELPVAIGEIETNLKKLFQNEKINYLMFMMKDPEVHFHVVPRYSADKEFEGFVFRDSAWPKKADIDIVNDIDQETLEKIVNKLRQEFNK